MMLTLTTLARRLLGLTGATQVALGLLFWDHRALGLLPIHMGIGLVFVLALLTLAVTGAGAGFRLLPLLAATTALVIPAFGMAQVRILAGPGHWIIQVTHLVIGVAGMFLGDRLTRAIRARRQADAVQQAGPDISRRATAA
jgi:hypothetical protein